ncbi:extracellular solute-binding protein [Crassaminicella profunda]|uniref:extracellular solute-binding protein n=1 Tax=Crassaminicella profunda TaxID=1286698 RepID=UPI001CA608EB|nr:extracellular solute-binding protein [Crassaminicella profunda]QZY54113.1 extracellular solute-binding protein [Crassaminicella profunda]
MKKRICFLLICTMLFSLVGCGNNNISTEEFYYEEGAFEKVDGNIMRVTNDEEGNIYAIVNQNTVQQYDSKGKLIRKFELEIPKDADISLMSIGIDQKKNLYIEVKSSIMFEKSQTNRIHEIWKFDEKGKVTEKIDVAKNDQGEFAYDSGSKLYINENNNFIYKNDTNQIIEVDQKGELVNTLVSEMVKDFVKIKNTLYAIILDENRETYLAKKEMGSQDYSYKKKIDGEQFIGFLGYDPKEGSLLYTTGSEEIKAFDLEGNFLKTVISVEDAQVFTKNIFTNGFAVNNDGNVYMSYSEMGSGEEAITDITVFVKKEGVKPKSKKKVITIGVNTEMEAMELRGKISGYMKAHPDTIIKINQYDYKEEYLSDYLKKMNTNIISGKGDDLIPTAYLPMSKYVKSGVFENLSDYMKKDKEFNMEDYHQNVFENLKIQGNYYSFPIGFKLGSLMANQDLLDEKNMQVKKENWNRESFINVLRELSQENGIYGLPNMEKEEIFEMFFVGDQEHFIDYENKKTNFNSESFKALLKDVQTIYDEKLIDENVTGMDIEGMNMYQGTNGKIVFMNQSKISLMFMPLLKNMIGNFKLYPYPSSHGKGGHAFTANAYGINVNSKNKELAWEVLKYLSGEKKDKGAFYTGIEMNKKSLEKQLDEMKNGENTGIIIATEGGELSSSSLTEENIKNIKDAIENTTINTSIDPQINKILKEAIKKYFAKEMAQEELIKTLDNKISTYLNE